MRIQDGKGKNGDMSVSSVQRGNVSAKTAPRMFYASRDFGECFNAISLGDNDYAPGEYCFYAKNTSSTRNLFVKHIEFHATDALEWKIFEASGTAAGGTVITPSNLNLGSGIVAEASCMGGGAAITGLTAGKLIGTHRNTALSESEMNFDGALILTPNKAIVVELEAEAGGTSGICEVDLFFWYEDLGAG